MNRIVLVVFILTLAIVSQGQSLTELKEKKAELEATQAESQAVVDGIQAEIDALNKEIVIASGWQKGILGSVGLNFGGQNNWATSANPNSTNSSLAIGINAFANRINEKDFWRNKGIVTLGWQSLNTDTNDDEGDGFLDDRTTDLLNLSSLYGRRLSDKIAVSALGELNSSVFNLFNPGTLDIGAGITYTPNDELVVVIHPLNFHTAFSAVDGLSNESSLGAKVRADYNHTFEGGLGWSSTFSTFIPYVSKEPTLFNYTWLNSLNYTLFDGLGVNLSFGIRNAEFESTDLQTYYTLGFSYGIAY
ncbi:MAG: DUF3078 domain-containing protein [Bacteroidota bacterium]